MSLQKPILLRSLLVLLGLTACATPQQNQTVLVFNNPGRIKLQVLAKNPADLPSGIEQAVTKNLLDWNYPVGGNDGEKFSHAMTATVGILTHGSTPAGFSFTIGNSDPRSLEFQKADKLPVSCILASITQPEQSRELGMDFIAQRTDKAYLAVDKLADHISTVCFNLLTEAKWPLKTDKEQTGSLVKSSSWIPEIRIEEKVTTESPTVTPVSPPMEQPAPEAVGEQAVKPSAPKPPSRSENSNVTIESNKPRRQIIIHNQGAPVILEFGYQRR